MKQMLTVLFSSCLFLGYSQQGTFSFGPSLGIEAPFFDFDQAQFNSNAEVRNGPRYQPGIRLAFHIGEHLQIVTGVDYRAQEFTVEHNYTYLSVFAPFIPRTTVLNTASAAVPLLVGYDVGSGKIVLTPAVGVDVGFLLKENEMTVYEDDDGRATQLHASEFTSPHVLIRAEIALNYKFSERFLIGIAPTMSHAVTNYDERYINGPELSMGGRAQVQFRLIRSEQ